MDMRVIEAELAKAKTLVELKEVSALLRYRWKQLQQTEAVKAVIAHQFLPGAIVKFRSRKYGPMMIAKIEKMNTKSVTVKVAGPHGAVWRVSPTFLQTATQAEYDLAAKPLFANIKFP
jgi:hypothetical protein